MSKATRRLIGLTGGIGSGKSTVAQMLVQHGAHLVDADAIARRITEPGGPALQPIAEAFGAGMVLPDGQLNRSALRDKVFNDSAARHQLEAITHPLVAEAISSAVVQQPAGVMILDIPLLVESKRWRKHLDAVVVVDCSPATQAQRVRQRNGWADDTIAAVIHAQASRELRLSAADMVVHNDGVDLTALQSHVAQLAHWLGL